MMILRSYQMYMSDIQGFDYENADEEDDGTFEVIILDRSLFSIRSKISFQGTPLSEIINIWQHPPTLTNMKDVQDRNHTFLIKVFP